MTHVFYSYLNFHVCHVLVLFSIHKICCLQIGIIIMDQPNYSSNLLTVYTAIFETSLFDQI